MARDGTIEVLTDSFDNQPNDLLNEHVSAPIPTVDAINKNATTSVAKLIRQMLGKTPADRPKSIKNALEQVRTIRFFEQAITLEPRDPSPAHAGWGEKRRLTSAISCGQNPAAFPTEI